MRAPLVVVGNGMTGARLVDELRARGFDDRIVVYGDEPGGSYNRIMLSGVLAGHRRPEEIVTYPPSWYQANGVDLRSGSRIVAIDRTAGAVVDDRGRTQPYERLVLATGSRALVPQIPGIGHPAVRVLRTLEDALALRGMATRPLRAVVVGGGLLGIEAAAGLAELGHEVTLLHLVETLMEVQLDAGAGTALERLIATRGITVRTATRASAIRADAGGTLEGVECKDGRFIGADVVVFCCGIVPNVGIAAEAGLAVRRGVVVDDALRTADGAIFALGECAEHRGVTFGSVDPLWGQCATVARRLCGEDDAAYEPPDGVALRLKVGGVHVVAMGVRDPQPGDAVATAIEPDGRYRRAIVRRGVLVGAQAVGDPDAAAAFAKAYTRGAPLAGSAGAFVFEIDAMPRQAAVATTPRRRAGDDVQICACSGTGRAEILAAIAGGAGDLEAIGAVTAAGRNCGTCRASIARLLDAESVAVA